MPGKEVLNWDQYHALREKGMSKSKAAAITNASVNKKKCGKPSCQCKDCKS
jgi:hypothetical protein